MHIRTVFWIISVFFPCFCAFLNTFLNCLLLILVCVLFVYTKRKEPCLFCPRLFCCSLVYPIMCERTLIIHNCIQRAFGEQFSERCALDSFFQKNYDGFSIFRPFLSLSLLMSCNNRSYFSLILTTTLIQKNWWSSKIRISIWFTTLERIFNYVFKQKIIRAFFVINFLPHLFSNGTV